MSRKEGKITKKDREDYQEYLADALPCIQQLRDLIGADENKPDFTPESFEALDIFLNSYREKIFWYEDSERLSDHERWLMVRVAYYVAEVLIQHKNMAWVLDTTKKSFSFGRAVLRRKTPYMQIEPLRLAFNIWKQKKKFAEWYENLS